MRLGRLSLVVGYVLAGLLAQGFHDHGETPPTPVSTLAPCQERRTHIESPVSTTAAPHPDDCLSCQLRSQSSLVATVPTDFHAELVATLDDTPNPTVQRVRTARPTGRAPPHA